MRCRIVRFLPGFVLLLFAFLYVSGCENTFDPLQENDQYAFSMYGAVDLYGEFTEIRVMPVGKKLIPTDPEPNGTEVSLIHDSTGERIVLNDSLFRFGGIAYVWNYFTDETLQANEEYTLYAKTPDEKQSFASITTPSELPLPEVEYSIQGERGTITGSSVDPLVSVETRYLVQGITEFDCTGEKEVVVYHLDDVVFHSDGTYFVEVENSTAIGSAFPFEGIIDIQVNKREVVVISASEDWPDLSGLTEEEIVLPDVVKNVENGTGFVAGIAGRRVVITPRQEPC